MNESIAIAKDADVKKRSLPTRSSDESVHRVQTEPERQLCSLRDVIGNLKSNGDTPSVDSIATHLSSMHTAQHAPSLLALQKTHGNRYVQRVVSGIQARLRIGQPGDVYEQEADRVADAVMRMPEPGVQRQVEPEEEEKEEEILQTKPLVDQITPVVQRQVEEEEMLQAKSREDATSEVTNGLESQINAIKGGGQPLAESERSFFEPRFGHDFSQVRLHTGTQAAESARAVDAKAYTMGRDVVFGARQFEPGTSEGRRLMAHELTHVIQQNGCFYKREIGNVAGNVTHLHQSRLIAREEREGAERVSSASVGPNAQNAAQNISNRYSTEKILIDDWSSDCRDNNKSGRFDSDDRFEQSAGFGSHIGLTRNGFRTIGGWTCYGGEGGQVNTVDFNTDVPVLYSVCAKIVSQAYRAAGVLAPDTQRVRDLINWFQQTNHNSQFWLLSNFPGVYLAGDFICSFDPQSGLGHAGMVVQSGSGTPMVIHLPGTSQHISRGIYDPTRLTDLTREPWPPNRAIYGIGRYFR